jgi:hypothetical protein
MPHRAESQLCAVQRRARPNWLAHPLSIVRLADPELAETFRRNGGVAPPGQSFH